MRRRDSYGCSDFKTIADARVTQIRQQIGKLRRLERRLRDISAHCAEGATTNCGVIEALWGADILDLELAPWNRLLRRSKPSRLDNVIEIEVSHRADRNYCSP